MKGSNEEINITVFDWKNSHCRFTDKLGTQLHTYLVVVLQACRYGLF